MNVRTVVLVTGIVANLMGCSDGAGTPGVGGSGGTSGVGGSGGTPGGGGASGNPGAGAAPCDLPAPAACGGSVIGTWKSSRSCDVEVSTKEGFACASSTRSSTAGMVLSFNADNTYAVSEAILRSSSVQTTPTSCFPATVTCATLNQDIMLSVQNDPGVISGSCATSGINCVCMFERAFRSLTGSGTYAASGTTLTLVAAGASAVTDSYCVQGNELHVMNRDSGGTDTEIVLTKQ